MHPKYKFILSHNADSRSVAPDWKDDLAKEYAFEQGQMFRRASLSGSLVFLNEDYDWIMARGIEAKIICTVRVQWQSNGAYTDYWRGSFHLTDCTINTDDRKITVKPNTEDYYNRIIAGLDKEYDLIKLKPANQPVQMTRRPMLQIYTLGEDVVSCFLGGMAWEQEVTDNSFTEQELTDDMHFGKMAEYIDIQFDGTVPVGLTHGFFGTWDHNQWQGEWNDFANEDGVYVMTYFQRMEMDQTDILLVNGLRIYAASNTDTVLWEFRQSYPSDQYSGFQPIPDTFTMAAKASGLSNLSATWTGTSIFGRWLVGAEHLGGYVGLPIPSNDLVANNRNYRYCIEYFLAGVIRTTNRSSASPTEYGIRPDGRYYLEPSLTADELLVVNAQYPIARSGWRSASIWLQWVDGMNETEAGIRYQTTLRDAYTLEAVINALLGAIDPTLTFAATSAYSEFLYGTNPILNDFGKLVITPKSNVLVAEYTQPAQKAMITLGEVLAMLRNALGCYWHIDTYNGTRRLRIEHISYYKNGMSYSGTPSVGWDVTQMINSRNGKKLTFGTGTYSFDKLEMPERYEYRWMDDTTDPFRGQAIEVRSTFVQEGNIDEINIAKFNPDIDYMMLNPSNVSEDGFALLCCQVSGTTYSTTIQGMEIGTRHVLLQNPKLAMINLQPNFLISDMPAWAIRVNGEDTTARGIQRKKKQQISVPVGMGDGNTDELVKTTVGEGEIERMSVSLTSRAAKFQLRFDTTTL